MSNDIQTLDTRPASTLAADWRRFLRDEQLSDVEEASLVHNTTPVFSSGGDSTKPPSLNARFHRLLFHAMNACNINGL